MPSNHKVFEFSFKCVENHWRVWAGLWNDLIYLLKADCGYYNGANVEKVGIEENVTVIWSRADWDLDWSHGRGWLNKQGIFHQREVTEISGLRELKSNVKHKKKKDCKKDFHWKMDLIDYLICLYVI